MKVGAVVLHYRFWPGMQRTLSALQEQTRQPDEVLIVDNASADGSAEQLRAARPELDLVVAPENRGYAAGMNLGLRMLLARNVDAVLLLTHETCLLPDAISHLIAELEADPQVGLAGPLLAWRSAPSTVYSAGGRIDTKTWHTFHAGIGEPLSSWQGRPARWVDFVDGAAMLVRRAAVDSVPPMEESYFMYYEEVDYQVCLRRNGWAVACVPAAVGLQEPGPRDPALWTRNRLRFVSRNAGRGTLGRELAQQAGDLARDAVRGRRELARGRAIGMAHFVSRAGR